ncbi:MAG: hypothetical protein RL335_483 [Bacteroidota bacterium]|jgi:phosphonate degradation associated HDIG domain protein
MKREIATQIVDEIFELYDQYGMEDYIGEPVSQLEHMCQSAQLAQKEGYDDELILAAFFHDIGHLCEHIYPVSKMEEVGVVDHEAIGMQFLKEKGFSNRVAKLVHGHVIAKRYLTFKFPDYYERLSPASKKTLEFQGGVMTESEAMSFEDDPLFEDYIRMRTLDDKAKIPGIPIPNLNYFKDLAISHLLKYNS